MSENTDVLIVPLQQLSRKGIEKVNNFAMSHYGRVVNDLSNAEYAHCLNLYRWESARESANG